MTTVFYSTIDSLDKANVLAEGLLTNKLASCVNVIPGMQSIYMWEGKLCKDEELVLIIKSSTEKFLEIEEYFKEHHVYDVPCLIEFSVSKISSGYQSWLTNQLK